MSVSSRANSPRANPTLTSTQSPLDVRPVYAVTTAFVKNNIGYREGSAIKYISRWQHKGGVEDLKKAIHCLEMIILEIETARGNGGFGSTGK